MNPILDDLGNVIFYYDATTMQVYDSSGQPIGGGGSVAYYDPGTNEILFTDPTQGGSGGIVTPTAPPAGVDPNGWAALFSQTVPAVINGISAWQLSQVNVKRAQAGLGPLNAALYAPGQTGFAATSVQNLILYGVIGITAFALLSGRRSAH